MQCLHSYVSEGFQLESVIIDNPMPLQLLMTMPAASSSLTCAFIETAVAGAKFHGFL